MEAISASELCLHLISSAYERCRVSGAPCRLSVVVSQGHPPPLLRVSISDTGVGSCLREFQGIKCLGLRGWGISDTEVFSYHLNLREDTSEKRLVRLPSIPKNGALFSGTEVSLSTSESMQVTLAEVECFFRKIQILKISNIAVEMVIKHEDVQESQSRNLFLSNEDDLLSDSISSLERLKLGLEDYVLKHGNLLSEKCESCFADWGLVKAGIGTVHSKETNRNSGLTVEVVIVVAQLDPACSYFMANDLRTEVLYFKDFKICSVPPQVLKELASIDWKSYGLSLANVIDEGCNFIQWASLPPGTQISMALHCYQKQIAVSLPRQKTHTGRHLMKRAVKLALSDLKEKHAGILLSAHAIKTLSYAPELARSIAGLILSSDDHHFQRECFSLLGLQSGENEGQTVEDCIRERIVTIVEMYDRKSKRNKEMASFLFDDDCSEDSNLQEFGYEQGEDSFISNDEQ